MAPSKRQIMFSMEKRGFTLLELLLALVILAAVSTITFMAFSTATMAWRRGIEMTDKIHHADFAVEQLVMALRSMYYPSSGVDSSYGFWQDDNGSGASAADTICWVKLGTALVGKDAPYAGGPHRVKVGVEQTEDGDDAIAIRGWGLLSQVEDFDEDDIEPTYYAMRIVGIDYRFQDPESDEELDTIEWIDFWEETNRIPEAIEISVYMAPVEDRDHPIEVKRIVEIPLAGLAWPGKK
jgi:prepilin-type N-terminal cleavage/methylation domain-containing protein